jgi:hypothetical protein
MHIYDHRFPVAPKAKLRPPDATVDDYRRLQKRLGLTRNGVVTPSTYGTDNSVTLDAIAKLGAAVVWISLSENLNICYRAFMSLQRCGRVWRRATGSWSRGEDKNLESDSFGVTP